MKSFIYILILLILIFAFSTLIKRHDHFRQENSCLHIRKTLLAKMLKPKNTYIPQCTLYGHYIPKQCNQSTGECWCVTIEGKEIPGTRTSLGKTLKLCKLNWFYELYRRMQ